jgi:glycosyltransferase involved in cell wall biosynthesis
VIIPAYNAERFISRTLDSVRDQTYRNIEVLVVDDGSQDQTAEIVDSMCDKDHRIQLLHQNQSGVAAARNTAIQKAKGQFIAPIDADDIWHPQNIEKQVQCMLDAEPSVGLVYAWSAVIDEQGILTGDFRVSPIEGDVYETLLSHNFLRNASACLIRSDCLNEVGFYNTQFLQHNAQGCEDWDLYLRIAENYQFRVVPDFLIGYRRVKNSMSSNFSAMASSHSFMLDAIRRENKNTCTYIYRLSSVNFYLYLAQDSNRLDCQKISFYWLGQAFRVDCITTLLSYRLYSVLFKDFLKLMAKALTLGKRSTFYFNLAYSWKRGSNYTLLTNPKFYRRKISIMVSLLMQKLYHRLIRTFLVKSARKS